MKKNILFTILFLVSTITFSQSITLTPTSAGTNTEGKMYYSTSTHSFQYWNGTAFIPLGGSSSGAGWSAIANDIINTNTGNVGVGLASPLSKFHIRSGGASGFTPGPTTSLFTETNSHNYLTIAAPNSFDAGILFGKPAAFSLGSIVYSGSNDMEFSTGATQRLVIKLNGLLGIYGTNSLEFGYGVVGKEVNAGKIGYGAITPNTLDIVGAGSNNTNRKVKIWAEGGTEISGLLTIKGEVNNPTKTGTANMLPIAYGIIDGYNGTIINGSGNFVFTKNDVGKYDITINGETFSGGTSGCVASHIVMVNLRQTNYKYLSVFYNPALSQGFSIYIHDQLTFGNYYDDVLHFVNLNISKKRIFKNRKYI